MQMKAMRLLLKADIDRAEVLVGTTDFYVPPEDRDELIEGLEHLQREARPLALKAARMLVESIQTQIERIRALPNEKPAEDAVAENHGSRIHSEDPPLQSRSLASDSVDPDPELRAALRTVPIGFHT